jgi:hypothetical protein
MLINVFGYQIFIEHSPLASNMKRMGVAR